MTKKGQTSEEASRSRRPSLQWLPVLLVPVIAYGQAGMDLFASLVPADNCKTRPMVLGIAGGSGSGKTTLADSIAKELGSEHVLQISHDNYYRDLSHMPVAERDLQNFDHPNALDTDLLVDHLKLLRNGSDVQMPSYVFASHTRAADSLHVRPRPIILVEGILIFQSPELRGQLDLRLFVDTEADTRFIRRLRRDVSERGRDVQSVIAQYEATVKPMHSQFVEPTKQFADLVLLDGVNAPAVDMLVGRLKAHVGEVQRSRGSPCS
eukprot:TRINITY_DN34462_c0_g1_i1.p1 TRINITY_DN34462_c0_g1~~TRINITY_DN34462_c0_g1_i1.p1  ORF type:complete len:265 (+),score=38.47 TRINITY_DN34462_c0_g1_i1:119-913(+)